MELRHLRYFAAVADTQHFGRAAERLHIAQPALSQAIRALETELGTPLFTRTTRQVRLTPAGTFLEGEAARILAAVDDSVRGVRRIAEGRQGLVRIAFTGSAAHTQLPHMAGLVKRVLPGIALEIHADLLTPTQLDGLHAGSLDLAILRPPHGETPGISMRTIEHEPLVLAVAADHPVARADEVHTEDLRHEPFILFANETSAVNEQVLRTCHAAGFSPRSEHRAAGVSVQLPLVAAGLGVALVPGSIRAAPLAGVVFKDVTDAGTVDLALAWRTDESNAGVLSVLDALSASLHSSPSTAFARSAPHSKVHR